MKYALIAVGALALMLGLTWILTGNEFFLYKFFAPKQEAVRREVFEQTKSFIDGSIRDIRADQISYIKADKEQKAAIASVVLHKIDGIPEDKLPPDLKTWVQELRVKQATPEVKWAK